MDPVSLTASIIAIIQLSGKVVSVCYDYRSAIKNSAEDAIKVIKEIKSLQDVLERLLQLAERDKAKEFPRLASLQGLTQFEGTLTLCRSELSSLMVKLEAPHGIKKVLRIMQWPLTEKEVKITLDSISQMKGTLCLAIATDQMSTLISIEESVNAMTLAQTEMILDSNRLMIHAWLHAPDPSSAHASARLKVHPGTGTWLLQHESYRAWESNSGTFLWLHGIPGCGKTILSSTVIEDLKQYCQARARSICSYFYFDFSDLDGREEHFLRSILVQISEQYPDTPPALNKLYRENGRGSQQPTQLAILAALKGLLENLDDVFIVIDALNEAKVREDVLATLSHIHGWSLQNVNVFVTSRRESDLVTGLSPIFSDEIPMDTSSVDHDVCCYVQTRLIEDPRLKRWPDSVRGDIEKSLMCDAQGMFRWVACQLDQLRRCIKLPALQTTLRSLPKTLHETYESILAEIDSEHSRDTLHVFQWLAFSARPVQLQEIVEVLAVDWQRKQGPKFDSGLRLLDPVDLLTVCSSLITLERYTPLSCAAGNGNGRIVQMLLEDGSDPDQWHRKSQKGIPLVAAAEKGFEEITKQLIPVATRFAIEQALGAAAENGHKNIVRLLIGTGIDHDIALSCAARVGAQDLVSELLAGNPTIDPMLRLPKYESHCGISALTAAAEGGHEAIVQEILSETLQPDADTLDCVVRQGHLRIVKIFLEIHGFEESALSKTLVHAAVDGYTSIALLLLHHGANIEHMDYWHGRPLHASAHAGHLGLVKVLLESGADINSTGGENGSGLQGSALQASAYRGDLTMVKYLLEKGADIDLHGFGHPNALQLSAMKGHKTVVEFLLEKGASLTSDGGEGNVLYHAIRGGRLEIANLLLKRGADPNTSRMNQSVEIEAGELPTPLLCAAMQGSIDMANLLLTHGAYVDTSAGYWGTTHLPLQSAAARGDLEIIHTFLAHGANINGITQDGWTAVHSAARDGQHDALRLLLADYHAEKDMRLVNGGSALHLAAAHGFPKCIDVLLEAGSDIDTQNHDGMTALHAAVGKSYYAAVERLVTSGASVETPDRNGLTPVDYAASNLGKQEGNESCHKILKILKAKQQKRGSLGYKIRNIVKAV